MNTSGMSVTKRLPRQERRAQTRAELLAAARRAFLREGFHAASLDAIAEEAGYTKGAFYSNFASKDDVLVAVLEEHFRDSAEAYESLVSSAETIEDAYGAVARFWHDANEREPEWSRLVIEFMAHASRNEKLRQAVREVRARTRPDRPDRRAAGRTTVTTIPISELVRGSGALNRGLAVEQLLDPGLSVEAFEEMHVAFIRGLTKQKRRTKEQSVTLTASTPTATDELLSHDHWSREQLLEYQGDRLREVIEHAVSASPYYREALDGDALAEDVRLEDLPTLSKQTLMEQFDRVVADPRLRLAALEARATGPERVPGSRARSTSSRPRGTTGRRGVLPQSAAEFVRWVAAAWRVRRRFGLDQGTRFVGIGAPTPLHITQKLFAAFGGFGNGRPTLAVTTPVPELVATLNDDRPESIVTVPSIAGLLAEEQLAGRLSIELRGIMLGGEVLTDDLVRRVDEAWGTEPVEVYASTEALIMAFRIARSRRPRDQRRPCRARGGGRGRPAGAAGHSGLPGPAHEPDRPRAAPDPLRAVRHRHARARPGAGRQALPPDRARRRAQRRHAASAEARRRRDGRPPLPVAERRSWICPTWSSTSSCTSRSGWRSASCCGREHPPRRPTESTSQIRAALEAAGAVPPTIEVEPVHAIELEPGSSKLKVVKTVREVAA